MSGEAAVTKITEKIEEKTEKEIQEILEEKEKVLAQIQRETEAKIKDLREKILKEAQTKAELNFQREKARYELEFKLKLSKFRDELVEKFITHVKEEIKKYLKTEKYLQNLEDLIISAAITLNEPELIIYIREEDKDKLTASFLSKIAAKLKKEHKLNVKLSVADKFIKSLGGVLIESSDGKIRINNTYDAKLERKMDEIRTKVATLIV